MTRASVQTMEESWHELGKSWHELGAGSTIGTGEKGAHAPRPLPDHRLRQRLRQRELSADRADG
jgi:hypothetical protein